MPCRPLLLDRWIQNRPICQSCLYSLQRKAFHLQAASYKSHTPRRPQRRTRLSNSVSRQASPAELNRYLEGIKELQRSQNAQSDDDNIPVRYFEEEEGQRSELDGEDEFNDSMSTLDRSGLKNLLFNIRDALGSDDQKKSFQAVMREVCGESNKLSSVADVEKLVARSQAYSKEIDTKVEKHLAQLPSELADVIRKEFARLDASGEGDGLDGPPYLLPEREWKWQHREKVHRLNNVLSRVNRDICSGKPLIKSTVSTVYKAYFIARRSMSLAFSKVPVAAWELLWKVLSVDESVHPNRMTHISWLARDMIAAKVPMDGSQQVLAMEAVFVVGEVSMAMKSWRKSTSSLGDEDSPCFQEFWELGVRMFCRLGELNEAESAADRLLAKGLDARILMPVIRTLTEKGTTESQERAWQQYRRMRTLLGKDMQLEDYDQVISYFLTTHKTDLALYAFVDMMFDGSIDMTQQKGMPATVANKYFIGKWLKRLMGAGDLVGAWRVVDFMRSKGVSAAPIQLNGLVGAWLRSGGAQDVENAERLAWDMIESRIRFVDDRRRKTYQETQTPPPWPRATHETFALLAASYSVRSLRDKMLLLWEAFGSAEMSADAFMMNQLLESYIQAGLHNDALQLYYDLVVDQKKATPDSHTFSTLWKTLAVSRLHSLSPEMLPEAQRETRRLFQETIRFRHVFPPEGMDGQLARKMLHSFRILQDNHALLLTLLPLHRLFNYLPTDTLALELALGTTRLHSRPRGAAPWITRPTRRMSCRGRSAGWRCWRT
ncbi:hypothetical protein CDD80_859 [Ophiocordyceps camponoti-rufipedis]|uniref:Pentatricopeptide repeat domain-containing protein n=1 Tax=Ophiocordyceps camponoti-rufipedis TaxID=2004952 RepID=A0A2C5ZBJ8_9HYPO|nr:hypothetical protein CDD80_859 [Ophiocordyceps camponoti-rufipedis]